MSEQAFRARLCHERKRCERSGEALLLMLVYRQEAHPDTSTQALLTAAAQAVSGFVRETDLVGWCQHSSVLGVLFTELGSARPDLVVPILRERTIATLASALTDAHLRQLQISFHVFPDDFKPKNGRKVLEPVFYPDLAGLTQARRARLVIKRLMDVVGSALALVALSPLFLLLGVAIKLTSKGPVLFRQQRLGQYGVPFVFLKFRSMRVSTSQTIHQEFVRTFIAGNRVDGNGSRQGCYKITNDPRVTALGKFMRRTSLDELPQFWNVLRGDMSLVGPRPPIPYEIDAYEVWHRRRIFEAKPGITGLWQVKGRSRTTFDEMVRLDLRYAREWSPALDLKILMQTPRAVFSGDGAF